MITFHSDLLLLVILTVVECRLHRCLLTLGTRREVIVVGIKISFVVTPDSLVMLIMTATCCSSEPTWR